MSVEPLFDTAAHSPVDAANKGARAVILASVQVLGPVAAALGYVHQHPEHAREVLGKLFSHIRSGAVTGVDPNTMLFIGGTAGEIADEVVAARAAAEQAKLDSAVAPAHVGPRHASGDGRAAVVTGAPAPAVPPAHGWSGAPVEGARRSA